MAKNKLRLVQLGETAAEVILTVQSQPVSKFIQRRSLCSSPIDMSNVCSRGRRSLSMTG